MNLQQLRRFKKKAILTYYLLCREKSLHRKNVLIESKNGKDLGGNMFRILQEISRNPDYSGYTVSLICNRDKKKNIKKMLLQYRVRNVRFLQKGSFAYARAYARAGFVFTDTTFPYWFEKRHGQVVTNTWHGTPLKCMGKDDQMQAWNMGNVQKSHLNADYLVYPGSYMQKIMFRAYDIENLYGGKLLKLGYPRNSVFFEDKERKKIKKRVGAKERIIYCYMPTWRGSVDAIDHQAQISIYKDFFADLDKELWEDEILMVRLHPFLKDQIDYTAYTHIASFPDGYEPYDILNCSACLITDYSSVMFDYLNLGKPIVRFVYDEDRYDHERGVYREAGELPFPKVRNVEELLSIVRSPKIYEDKKQCRLFCTYDCVDSAKLICEAVLKNNKQLISEAPGGNGKENILVFSGKLQEGASTDALQQLLDRERPENLIVTFNSTFYEGLPERVAEIVKKTSILPIAGIDLLKLGEKKNLSYYRRFLRQNFGHLRISGIMMYVHIEQENEKAFVPQQYLTMLFGRPKIVEENWLRWNFIRQNLT